MICQSCRAALRAQRILPRSHLTSTTSTTTNARSMTSSAPAISRLAPTSKTTDKLSCRSFRTSNLQTPHSRPLSTSRLLRFSSTSSPAGAPPQQQQEDPELPSMTAAETAIADILSEKLAPTQLFVQDISGGCGSMYAIEITSPAFRGLGILKQQRMVNAALGDMMKTWHGVQIRTKVPPEDA